MKRRQRFGVSILACALGLAACGGEPAMAGAEGSGASSAATSGGATTGNGGSSSGSGGGSSAGSGLPELEICEVPSPATLSSAYAITQGNDFIAYACKKTCTDWTACVFDAMTPAGQPLVSQRGGLPLKGLAFVVAKMAGHFVFTQDGDVTVLTHGGSGGTDLFHPFDKALQATTSAKTISLGWEQGLPEPLTGSGWFTRPDANPTSIKTLDERPSAAILWAHEHLASGNRFATASGSLGSVATLGAVVWHGLDSIIDYQLLIGGPASWDINAGCGRVHVAAGHCDVDASPCMGNPMSNHGEGDPACPGTAPTNQCRTPTTMWTTEYNQLVNYVHVTNTCVELTEDSRDPTLDEDSMMTLSNWSIDSPTDFIADEGGSQATQPADNGMGEGHAMDVYAAIQGDKQWIDVDGRNHGDSFTWDPVLIGQAAQHLAMRMGLAP